MSRTKSVNLEQRFFFYIPATGEDSVNRNRPDRKFKEIKGIRKFHPVKCTTEQEKIFKRHRSCYCLDCLLETGNHCTNSGWVDDWEELSIEREASPATTRQNNTMEVATDTAVLIADLAVEGSVVAIAADADSSYDYYLLKVKSDGVEELAEDVTDDFGIIYTTGQEVLRTLFAPRQFN